MASSSWGRLRVSPQLKHSPPSLSVSQVQPDSVRLRHRNHSKPSASTYRPFSSTGTIARSERENPSRLPHDTQREFSKCRGLSHTRHRKAFTPAALHAGQLTGSPHDPPRQLDPGRTLLR